MSAAAPAAYGLDIDVPAMDWNNCPGGPAAGSTGSGVSPASTWSPGAITSGLMNPPTGPREENVVI